MAAVMHPTFDCPDLAVVLAASDAADLDALAFGVIGFDAEGIVRAYNRFESEAAGLSRDRVVGRPLFDDVAPCMNNFMVAERFVDAAAAGQALDALVPYVLTLRMKPTRVVLRLVAQPGSPLSYVLVERRTR